MAQTSFQNQRVLSFQKYETSKIKNLKKITLILCFRITFSQKEAHVTTFSLKRKQLVIGEIGLR